MRHRKKKKFNLSSKKRNAVLRNLATSIILYERIRTVDARAKAVVPIVSKAIRLGKRGDLTARRELLKILSDKKAVAKTIDVLGKKYKDRSSGFIRRIKVGNRKGDDAPLVQIELV